MGRIRNYVFASSGSVALIGSLVFAGAGVSNPTMADKGSQDVKVVNTPAEPLPTQAHQSGNWDVGITGTPTFQIANAVNDPVLVRDVDNPARQPFLQTLVTSNNASFTVPLGKRLVVEYVSGFGNISSGQRFRIVFLKTVVVINGQQIGANNYFTPILTGGDNGLDTFVVSQHTRLYAEAGSIVELSTAATEDGSSFTVTVSGYLVDR